MKNQLIIVLVNCGLLATTEHSVPAKDAYKVYKFRRECGKAYDELAKRERDFAESAGVEGEPTPEQAQRIAELRAEMLADESEINVTPMPYESFHALANENKETLAPNGQKIDIFRVFEEDLEGILWVAPTE